MTKPQFHNTPPEQNEEAKVEIEKAEEYHEKQVEKQNEIKEQLPNKMEWIQTAIFWGMVAYIAITSILIPLARDVKYKALNREEVQFTQEKPELVKAMKAYRDARIKETDEKILEAFQ
jgi:hypothetical protein